MYIAMKRISVYIADDEISILDGIKNLFDWDKNGFDIVGEALDGLSAEKDIMDLAPDIAILDIDMPLKSGLEIIYDIKPSHPDIHFIILSAYSDYEFMRQAVQMHISDYLLKPLSADNLQVTLYKVCEMINDESVSNFAIPPMENENGQLFTEIVHFINEHLCERLSLSILSQKFHYSEDYISAYFKRSSSICFIDYINICRVAKVKELLKSTDKSLGEIAELTGFSDYRYMNKVFYHFMHITPSQYRKNTKQHGIIFPE